MELSQGEKIIITMLANIYKKLDITDDYDPDFLKTAILDNQAWSLASKYPSIGEENVSPKAFDFVSNVMTMWRVIETTYAKLSNEDKSKVDTACGSDCCVFVGFDGNASSGHFGIAKFMIEKMDWFEEFSECGLNSHSAVDDKYSDMLSRFDPIMESKEQKPLTADDLIEIIIGKR
jgi:hypothetical protein